MIITLLFNIVFCYQYYGQNDFGLGFGQDPFLEMNCPVSKCYATSDRNLIDIERVDAILWNLGSKDKSLPKSRLVVNYFISQ